MKHGIACSCADCRWERGEESIPLQESLITLRRDSNNAALRLGALTEKVGKLLQGGEAPEEYNLAEVLERVKNAKTHLEQVEHLLHDLLPVE